MRFYYGAYTGDDFIKKIKNKSELVQYRRTPTCIYPCIATDSTSKSVVISVRSTFDRVSANGDFVYDMYDYPRRIFRILYDRRSKINYFRNRFVFIRIKPVWRIMIIRDTSFGRHICNNIGIMFTSIYLNYYYSVYSDQNFEFFFPIPENTVKLTIFPIKM